MTQPRKESVNLMICQQKIFNLRYNYKYHYNWNARRRRNKNGAEGISAVVMTDSFPKFITDPKVQVQKDQEHKPG